MKRRKAALIQSAQRFLEPGETPRTIYIGQTFVSPLIYALIGPIVFIFVARQRAVLVTDRYVRVLKPNFWKSKQVDEELARFPIAEARIERTKLGLSVGGGPRIYAFLFGFKDMAAVEAAVQGRLPQQV